MNIACYPLKEPLKAAESRYHMFSTEDTCQIISDSDDVEGHKFGMLSVDFGKVGSSGAPLVVDSKIVGVISGNAEFEAIDTGEEQIDVGPTAATMITEPVNEWIKSNLV